MTAFRLKFEIKLAESKKTVFEELMPFLVAMGSEGERSAVVLGAERINVAVEALLKTFLLPSQNRTDNLFSTDGALATFREKSRWPTDSVCWIQISNRHLALCVSCETILHTLPESKLSKNRRTLIK
jgi:hypothetical protein